MRAAPFLTVGVLGLLALGGLLLSLAEAPPVAVTELHTAAAATLAASGFDLTDTNTATPLGPSGTAGSVTIRVRYEAPDAVEETGPDAAGHQVTVRVVGSRRFGLVGPSRWTELPPAAALGAKAAETFLSPLRAAASAPVVTGGPTTFRLVPAHEAAFVARLLGRPSAQLTKVALSARVQGEFLTDERITAVLGTARLQVDLAFTTVGRAGSIPVPPPSELVASP